MKIIDWPNEGDVTSNWGTDEVKVSVCCLSYNHEDYIEECVFGMVSQNTQFAFEIIIHDDASTDGTRKILEDLKNRYPKIIKLILQDENQFRNEKIIAPRFLFPLVKSKYIAMCEGDDYWTDKFKLQSQFDCLEKNKHLGMVVHKAVVFDCNTQKNVKTRHFAALNNNAETLPFKDFALSYLQFAPTSSYFFRTNLVHGLYNKIKGYYAGDLFIEIITGVNGFAFINKEMSVYRVFTKGSYSYNNQDKKNAIEGKMIVASQLREFKNHFSDYSVSRVILNKAIKYEESALYLKLKTDKDYDLSVMFKDVTLTGFLRSLKSIKLTWVLLLWLSSLCIKKLNFSKKQ
ncbi:MULTISPECIES: glycosyltransferase [unclassified Pseudoalteromonas]|uniref:glycosyltransferase family 2 protein n=1 Tax=unclassified Pseudoalteromonas TaxID=194690 RepID=UPI00143F71A3|nr:MULTISPECIES: glycosyltransferase [unclassified Pseudoalteromonas]MCF2901344.1 glycosyltransferase [Pseudoalteromonas sp. OFAV1]